VRVTTEDSYFVQLETETTLVKIYGHSKKPMSDKSSIGVCCMIMAVLSSRCGHYIFALWFLLSSSFFPCLISAVADWMSTILAHMVWPQCKFRMHV